ncbi:hypothetical protein ABB34_09120 [Stenotrophomonas daejeonensis]|uniref:Uncharacterized protein n=2 Tax=Stenotrophomonas daejeonensis TaxID=659018 RepID=A0A0R0E3R5_9GAMM|nr:hypothetical protein ABB34_09120 [Stenotrophomonas daejeonensis]
MRPMNASLDPFLQFLQQCGKNLQRIANATKGEYSRADVAQEAWLLAGPLAERHGLPLDFLDPGFQDLLLRHLYQALVRYTDLHVRHGLRLDHAPGDDAEEGTAHPLMNHLTSDEGRDPLAHLLLGEERAGLPDIDAPHPSLAGAWLVLLQDCGQHMPSVAMRLLISVSWAYRCCAKARRLAREQHPIALTPPHSARQLGPWRKHRATRAPRQLEFDFGWPTLVIP